jgi:hypothetical protein
MNLSILTSARENWELYLDEANNYYYWFNTETGETKWDTGYEEEEDDDFSLPSPAAPDKVPMSPHVKNTKIIDPRVINRIFRKHLQAAATATAAATAATDAPTDSSSEQKQLSSEGISFKSSYEEEEEEEKVGRGYPPYAHTSAHVHEDADAKRSSRHCQDKVSPAGARWEDSRGGAEEEEGGSGGALYCIDQDQRGHSSSSAGEEKYVKYVPQERYEYAEEQEQEQEYTGQEYTGQEYTEEEQYTEEDECAQEEYAGQGYEEAGQRGGGMDEYMYQADSKQEQDMPSRYEGRYDEGSRYEEGSRYDGGYDHKAGQGGITYQGEAGSKGEYSSDFCPDSGTCSGSGSGRVGAYTRRAKEEEKEEEEMFLDHQYQEQNHNQEQEPYYQQEQEQYYQEEQEQEQCYQEEQEQCYQEEQEQYHQEEQEQYHQEEQQQCHQEEQGADQSRQRRLLQQAWGEENSSTARDDDVDDDEEEEGKRQEQKQVEEQEQEQEEDDWGDLSNVHLTSTSESRQAGKSPPGGARSPGSRRSNRGAGDVCRGRLGQSEEEEEEEQEQEEDDYDDSPLPSASRCRVVAAKKGFSRRSQSGPADYKDSRARAAADTCYSQQLQQHTEEEEFTSPHSRSQPRRQDEQSHYHRASTWQQQSEHTHEGEGAGARGYGSSSSFSSPQSSGGSPQGKLNIIIPTLNMSKLQQSNNSHNKKRSQESYDHYQVAHSSSSSVHSSSSERDPGSPAKKMKAGLFVAGVLDSICDEKRAMQEAWEAQVFAGSEEQGHGQGQGQGQEQGEVFDPRVPLSSEEGAVSLLEVCMYLGCKNDMMDLHLAAPSDLFLQYVAQASKQYSVVMQGGAMRHQECIRAVALHGIFRECRMEYLLSFCDFSTANNDAAMISILQTISIDDIIYKYPFVSFTSYALSHPLPLPLPEDQVAYCPSAATAGGGGGGGGQKQQNEKGFWSQIRWLFRTLRALEVRTYGQLMTYTTGVFLGHALHSQRGELFDEYVTLVLSQIGGSFATSLLVEEAASEPEDKTLKQFMARAVLLSTPIKLETYFYECCVHFIDGSGYRSYDEFGPSVGGFLLSSETEWRVCISDLLQLMALGRADDLPEFSAYATAAVCL